MGYRRAYGKVLTADIRDGVKPSVLRKLWAAKIMFASDLFKPKVAAQARALPGIGDKTMKQLLEGARKAIAK